MEPDDNKPRKAKKLVMTAAYWWQAGDSPPARTTLYFRIPRKVWRALGGVAGNRMRAWFDEDNASVLRVRLDAPWQSWEPAAEYSWGYAAPTTGGAMVVGFTRMGATLRSRARAAFPDTGREGAADSVTRTMPDGVTVAWELSAPRAVEIANTVLPVRAGEPEWVGGTDRQRRDAEWARRVLGGFGWKMLPDEAPQWSHPECDVRLLVRAEPDGLSLHRDFGEDTRVDDGLGREEFARLVTAEICGPEWFGLCRKCLMPMTGVQSLRWAGSGSEAPEHSKCEVRI